MVCRNLQLENNALNLATTGKAQGKRNMEERQNIQLFVWTVCADNSPLWRTALAGLLPPRDSLLRCWWLSARHSSSANLLERRAQEDASIRSLTWAPELNQPVNTKSFSAWACNHSCIAEPALTGWCGQHHAGRRRRSR